MSCGVGHRRGSDPVLLLLWLWLWLAATAPIRPLAWEPPYTTDVALKKDKRPKKKKKSMLWISWTERQLCDSGCRLLIYALLTPLRMVLHFHWIPDLCFALFCFKIWSNNNSLSWLKAIRHTRHPISKALITSETTDYSGWAFKGQRILQKEMWLRK